MGNWRERLSGWLRDPVAWGAAVVFLTTQVVYLLTMNLSCPFWDSGEFITTSYILGIPHPPGTPLYVLIGRLFTLLPFGQVATRVNFLSAFASALTALFSYLVIVYLARRWARREETRLDLWLAIGGGVAGAFFLAFSRTFWDNAVEAEVYALASFLMILSVWLMLRWDASGGEGRRDPRYLLLIVFLLFAGVGIHMGALLVGPALLLYLLLRSPRTLLERDTLAGIAWIIAAVVLFAVLRAAHLAFLPALLIVLAGYGSLLAWRWQRWGLRNLATWALGMALLGLSVHFFLIIRAQHDPVLNLADPGSWENLWLVLSRDQYKPANPFLVRQASWDIQFTKHFWRYWQDQFDLGLRPQWFSLALPYGIGLLGALAQAWRDGKRFALMLALVLMSSVFLVFYLNFREDEVRDRDYFFVAGYHFFALWIGLGVTAIGRWLRGERPAPRPAEDAGMPAAALARAAAEPGAAPAAPREAAGEGWPLSTRLFSLGGVALLVVLSLFPMRHGWFEHDRTGFLVARDYAYNMLTPLERDAVVFTNGDNDTYPLWYIQYVEGVRPDVRVVNLSLLNTPWYIRQIRDYEPRVKVTLPDREIDDLHGVILPSGKVVMVKDMMVYHVIEENPGRPIYIAVTVPELMELDSRLVMEGLVYRVESVEGEPQRTDVEKTLQNLREVYRYAGLLDAEGRYDPSVYKDSTARKLVQNYVVAYVEIAKTCLEDGRTDLALEALEAARRINPEFPAVNYTLGYLWMQRGEFARAEQCFREMLDGGSRASEVYQLLGAALEAQNRMSEAEEAYRAALARDPEDFDGHRILFTMLWNQERKDEAREVIEGWLRSHPEDEATRRALQQLLEEDAAGGPAREAAGAASGAGRGAPQAGTR